MTWLWQLPQVPAIGALNQGRTLGPALPPLWTCWVPAQGQGLCHAGGWGSYQCILLRPAPLPRTPFPMGKHADLWPQTKFTLCSEKLDLVERGFRQGVYQGTERVWGREAKNIMLHWPHESHHSVGVLLGRDAQTPICSTVWGQ